MNKKNKNISKKRLYIIGVIVIIAIIVIITLLTTKKYPKKIKLEGFTKEITNSYFSKYLKNIEVLESGIQGQEATIYAYYYNIRDDSKEVSLETIQKTVKEIFNLEINEMDIIHSNLFEHKLQYLEDKKVISKLEEEMFLPHSETIFKNGYFIDKIYQTSEDTYEIYTDIISPNDIQDFIDYYSSEKYLKANNNEEVIVDSSQFTETYGLKDFLTEENYEQLGTQIGTGKLTLQKINDKFIIRSYELVK